MIRRWRFGVVLAAGLVIVFTLLGWARAYVPLMATSASDIWSRGRLIGVASLNLRPDLQVGPDGGLFITWVDSDDRLHVAHLPADSGGKISWDRKPSLGERVPHGPRLLVDGDGIHLIWREVTGQRSRLVYALLDRTAAVKVSPLFLSPQEDYIVRSPGIVFGDQGNVEVFWIGQAGLYRVVLGSDGVVRQGPTVLVEGENPLALQTDRNGRIHLAWTRDVESGTAIYYAVLDPTRSGVDALSEPEEMARLFISSGQSVESIAIGLDDEYGYVVWVVEDAKYVSSNMQFAVFPVEIPRQKRVRDLELRTGVDPLYLWAVRGQHETALMAFSEVVRSEDGPQLQIAVRPLRGEGPAGEQVWAQNVRILRPRGDRGNHGGRLACFLSIMQPIMQPIMPPMNGCRGGSSVDGDGPDGLDEEHVVTASVMASLKPTIDVDGDGDFHLTWLETGGFDVYRVAYASTDPMVRKVYNRLTLWDVTDRVLGVAMQFFLAVGLTPVLAIYWALAPLIWLFAYLVFTSREHLETPKNWGALGIAVVLEVISTYLIYPIGSVMPPVWQSTLPLVTAACGVGLALLYVMRKDDKPIFGAFFVFAIVHGLLEVLAFVLLR